MRASVRRGSTGSLIVEGGRIVAFFAAIVALALCFGAPSSIWAGAMADRSLLHVPNGSETVIGAEDTALSGRIIGVHGTPAQMGYQHGSGLRAEIRQAVSDALRACASVDGATWRSCRGMAEGLRQSLSPTMVQELQGIARGAGVREIDILLLNAMPQTLWREDCGSGSSHFAAWGKATLDHQVILGASWVPAPGQTMLWINRQPHDGKRTLLLGSPGWLGGVLGLNEDRLIGAASDVAGADTAPAGLPGALVLRRVLEDCTTPEEASIQAMGLSHSSGAQIVFGSRSGVQGVEFSAHQQRVLRPELDTITAAGLYHDPDMSITQVPVLSPEAVGVLQGRWDRLDSMLRANVGWIGIEKALAVLASLADHSDPGRDQALVLFAPALDTLWLGNPAIDADRFLVFDPFDLVLDPDPSPDVH